MFHVLEEHFAAVKDCLSFGAAGGRNVEAFSKINPPFLKKNIFAFERSVNVFCVIIIQMAHRSYLHNYLAFLYDHK